MFDQNSTAELIGAFGVLDKPSSFIRELFMRYVQTFESEEVYFDQVQRARRLAAFVAPTVAGKPMRQRGYGTKSFKPPYLKPKHVVEPIKAQKRMIGEKLLGGAMSNAERFARAVILNMLDEEMDITRRETWMIMQLLLTGRIPCEGEDYPLRILDMDRDPSLTTVLTGALRWGQPGVDPLQNLRAWSTQVQVTSGYKPKTVILDPLSGDFLINSPSILRVMQSFRQTAGNIDLAGKTTGGAVGDEVAYLGSLPEFDFWQYNELWADDEGETHPFMPPNTVILANVGAAQGIMTYGAILDKKADLKAVERFPKMWDNEDPPQTMTMTQSAPLPIFGWIQATFCATVG